MCDSHRPAEGADSAPQEHRVVRYGPMTAQRLALALPGHRYCSDSYPQDHQHCVYSAEAILRNLIRLEQEERLAAE